MRYCSLNRWGAGVTFLLMGCLRYQSCVSVGLKIFAIYTPVRLLPIIAVLAVFGELGARPLPEGAEPAENSNLPVNDQWRWRELEQLSQILIECLDESPDGTLWIGGPGGLHWYDGYKVRLFPLAELDQRIRSIVVLSEEHIHILGDSFWGRLEAGRFEVITRFDRDERPAGELVADQRGNVYLGVGQELLRWGDAGLEVVLREDWVIDEVACSASGVIWVASEMAGKLRLQSVPDDSRFADGVESVVYSSIALGAYPYRIFPDSKGRLWVISRDPDIPPFYYNEELEEFILDDLRTLGGLNTMTGFAESDDGVIWISTRRFLQRFANDSWEVLDSEELDVPTLAAQLFSLSDDSLLVCAPRDKTMLLDRGNRRFTSHDGRVFQITDQDGDHWFITKDGSIGRNSADGLTWEWYGAEDGIPDTPSAIFESTDGRIWVSGSHQNSASVSRFNGRSWQREMFSEMGYRIAHLSPVETSNGDVLFGNGSEYTLPIEGTGGLVRFRKDGPGGAFVFETPPQVPYRISGMVEDAGGTLFFSGPAFTRVEADAGRFTGVPGLEFPGWWIDHMVADRGGTLWLCVWGRGVYTYREGRFDLYSENNGFLTNRSIFALPNDSGTGAWVSTQEGVVRFDGESWTPIFEFVDPVAREANTLVAGEEGVLWMNFAPREWFFRKAVDEGMEGEFRSIRYAPEFYEPRVELAVVPSYRQLEGGVYFEWAGADFWSETPEDALEFSYRVNEEEWSPFSRQRQVLLTGTEVGAHRFEVRARDRDWNISSDWAKHEFLLVAPLWQRPWFIALTVFVIGIIVVLIVLVSRNRIRHLLEVEELKIQFFTYLSHELRTPLAVVLGPIESAMRRIEDRVTLDKLSMAKKNANRVLRLVDQLLDFRKFEYAHTSYSPRASDLMVFLRDCADSLGSLFEGKNQSLELSLDMPKGRYLFDPDMLQKLFNNLVSNAVKYSPEGSVVLVTAALSEGEGDGPGQSFSLNLTVTDEGPGIEREAQRMVFEPFYRVRAQSAGIRGAGLGLALVKDLVERWGGTVKIISPCADERGTSFVIVLPVELAPDSRAAISEDSPPVNDTGDQIRSTSRNLILLVDDDEDFRTFVASELSGRFEVLLAKDGAEGIQLAREHTPELILSDFHMPGMTGEVLCRSLKENLETSHIPIILLTSDRSKETEMAGVKSLADEFLKKPIDVDLLIARLDAVLATRRRLRELFAQQVKVDPEQIAVTLPDQRLLSQAIETVELNIQDDEFGVEEFATGMGMGQRTLYRKISAITGTTPLLFIRSIRLKRAAQMFQAGITSVSDAMVAVGILDASYFSRIFKKEFGESPSQYISGVGSDLD